MIKVAWELHQVASFKAYRFTAYGEFRGALLDKKELLSARG